MSLRLAACAALFACAALPLSALAQAAPVPAQAASPAPEPSEIARVTTSDRQDEPIARTTRPTFIVDRRAIEAMGARTVADALRTIPGVQLFRYGAFGSQVNYGILGATSAQTLILLDGIPLHSASTGTIDLATVSTAGVSRIEVVESAGSTLYGTGAVGGIINIITGAPQHSTALVAAGSLGDREVKIDSTIGRLGFALERHTADNAYAYPSLDGRKAGSRVNSDAQQTAARITYRQDFGTHYSLDAHVGDDAVAIGVPGSVTFATPNARQRTSRSDARVTLTRRGERSSLALTLGGSRQSLAYADPDNGGESDTYDGRTQLSLRSVVGNDTSSLVNGIDLARESTLLFLGATSMPPTASAALSQSAAYTQYTTTLGSNARIVVGLRGEHDSPQGSVLLPALGTKISLGRATFAANYGATFRVPTVDDLYYPGFSNPLLVPERAQSLDASLAAPLRGGQATLSWFSRQAINLIALDANFTPQNISRASLAGFVLSGRSNPMHGIVATVGVTNLYRAADRSPGKPQSRLRFDPAFTTMLGVERPLGPTSVGFGLNARTEASHIERSNSLRNGETTVDAWIRSHLAVGVVTLRARNLGNERYASILGYPAAGSTFELELSNR